MRARAGSTTKRMVDVMGAAVALILTAPVLVVAAAAVRWTLGSPVLFRQERAGRHGQVFRLVKLRTMRHPLPGREGYEHDHERLTPLGRFLRATSIDELPSLWNVLRGDLSLVGPRPLPVPYLDRYTATQARRHEVRPGITGWAQVHGRNLVDWDERLDLDVWYVDRRSLALDLKILALTVLVVLRRQGISRPGHDTMSEFLGSTHPG